MNISKITSTISQKASGIATKASEFVQKHPKLSKAVDIFEPNGGDNSFFGLATIMCVFVLIPRIKSALNRNPDDKEKTKDEIKEILFRDIQTILIMLFGLKSLNSIIGNLSTKISGIPVVDVPYKKLFNEKTEGFLNKAKDAIKNPVDKLKTLGSNILATLNPIGGSSSLNGEQINSLYTGYSSPEDFKKLLKIIPEKGGDPKAVFNKVKNSIVEHLNKCINDLTANKVVDKSGEYPEITKTDLNLFQETLNKFKELTYEKFMENNTIPEDVNEEIRKFLNDNNNALVKSARRVSDWLRMLALGIEVSYLGFGLPALNQKRLEKKYLNNDVVTFQGKQTNQATNQTLIDKNIKPQEIKVFKNFIK